LAKTRTNYIQRLRKFNYTFPQGVVPSILNPLPLPLNGENNGILNLAYFFSSRMGTMTT